MSVSARHYLAAASSVVAVLFISSKAAWAALPDFTVSEESKALAQAAAQAAPQTSSKSLLKVDVRLTLLDAIVETKQGEVIQNLKKENFTLQEDGKQQEIVHFEQFESPLAIALLIDESGSIAPYVRELHDSAVQALEKLKSDDQVALWGFNSMPQRILEFTSNKHRVRQGLEQLGAGGSTDINDAFDEAMDALEKEAPPQARRVIIIVSDNSANTCLGNDNRIHGLGGGDFMHCTHDHNALVGKALESDVMVYSIKVPGDPVLTSGVTGVLAHTMAGVPMNSGIVTVKKLVEATGGELFDITKTGGVGYTFQRVIDQIRTRYTLGFYSTNPNLDGKFRRLNLKLKGVDGIVRAKRGYYARPLNMKPNSNPTPGKPKPEEKKNKLDEWDKEGPN